MSMKGCPYCGSMNWFYDSYEEPTIFDDGGHVIILDRVGVCEDCDKHFVIRETYEETSDFELLRLLTEIDDEEVEE